MRKEPFSLHDPVLRGILLDFSILLNYTERFDGQQFHEDADELYETIIYEMLEQRINKVFHEGFEKETREFSFNYLKNTASHIVTNLNRECSSRISLDELITINQKDLKGAIDISHVADSDIRHVEFRIKSMDSLCKKILTTRKKKTSESGRHDFAAMRIIFECQGAKDYLRQASFALFSDDAQKKAIDYMKGFVDYIERKRSKGDYNCKKDSKRDPKRGSKRDDNGRKKAEATKAGQEFLKQSRKILDKKGVSIRHACDSISMIMLENEDLFSDYKHYHEFKKRIAGIKSYGNLLDDYKKEYNKRFEKQNVDLVKSAADELIKTRGWITIPYHPISMHMDMWNKTDITKDATFKTQIFMSRDEQYEVDYAVLSNREGLKGFLNRLGIKKDTDDIEDKQTIFLGQREHGIGENKAIRNCALYRNGNIVVYISTDEDEKHLKDFARQAFEKIGHRIKQEKNQIHELESIIESERYDNRNTIDRKKRVKKKTGKQAAGDSSEWDASENVSEYSELMKSIYMKKKNVLNSICLEPGDISPAFALYSDTFRGEIMQKFPGLEWIRDDAINRLFFARWYLHEYIKSNGYEAVHVRICPGENQNKELGIEIELMTPQMYEKATKGDAEHEKYKMKRYNGFPEIEKELPYVFFGEDDEVLRRFYMDFHSRRIKRYVPKAVNSFIEGDLNISDKALKKVFSSYMCLNRYIGRDNFSETAVEAESLIRSIIMAYYKKDPLCIQDVLLQDKEGNILRFQDIVRYNLDEADIDEDTRKFLDLTDLVKISKEEKALYSLYCEGVIYLAKNLSHLVKENRNILAEKTMQTIAYHFIQDMHNYMKEISLYMTADTDTYKRTAESLNEIFKDTKNFVETQWIKSIDKYEEMGIHHMPFPQKKQHKIICNLPGLGPETVKDVLRKTSPGLGPTAADVFSGYVRHFIEIYTNGKKNQKAGNQES